MYPSDMTPRRRMQAVPTMNQMVRRRAASPYGVIQHGGAPVMGQPVQAGGLPTRSSPGGYPVGGDTHPVTTQPVAQTNPAPNPNQFLGPHDQRDPRAHLAWWQQNGWTFNNQTGRFHFTGGQGGPGMPGGGGGDSGPGGGKGGGGGGSGPGGGGSGGGGGTGGDGGGTTPPPTDLPLDAIYEAQRRQYDDALQAQLAALNPMTQNIAANQVLQSARLGTNQTMDQRSMLESLAGRGAFGGGIQTRDTGNLATNYMRQYQDLANQTAQQYGNVDLQKSQAQAQYSNSLAEALLALAQRQAQSQYAPTPH